MIGQSTSRRHEHTVETPKSKSAVNRESIGHTIDLESDRIEQPNWVAIRLAKRKKDQIAKEDIIFCECPATLQNAKYDKTNKKLRVKKVKLENENIIDLEHLDIDLSSIDTMGFMVLQQSANDAITQNVTNMLVENHMLKRKLKELRDITNPAPLLMIPLEVRSPSSSSLIVATLQTFNKVANLLNAVKTYILENICKRLEIV